MDAKFLAAVKKIVYLVLRNENLLQGQWHSGKIVEILSDKLLSVCVDGSKVPQKIPCNPDIDFSIGEHVFVIYINGNPKDKYIPFKRAL